MGEVWSREEGPHPCINADAATQASIPTGGREGRLGAARDASPRALSQHQLFPSGPAQSIYSVAPGSDFPHHSARQNVPPSPKLQSLHLSVTCAGATPLAWTLPCSLTSSPPHLLAPPSPPDLSLAVLSSAEPLWPCKPHPQSAWSILSPGSATSGAVSPSQSRHKDVLERGFLPSRGWHCHGRVFVKGAQKSVLPPGTVPSSLSWELYQDQHPLGLG